MIVLFGHTEEKGFQTWFVFGPYRKTIYLKKVPVKGKLPVLLNCKVAK